MTDWHVAPQHVGGHHPDEIDRILGAAELRRVAELGFLQIVDRRAHLERHRQRADPLVDAVDAERLRLPPGRPLLLVESVDVAAGGRPVVAKRARFAADRVTLLIGS